MTFRKKNFKILPALDPLHRNRRERPRQPSRAPSNHLPQSTNGRQRERQAAQGQRRRRRRRGSGQGLPGDEAQRRSGSGDDARSARSFQEAADDGVDARQAAVLGCPRRGGGLGRGYSELAAAPRFLERALKVTAPRLEFARKISSGSLPRDIAALLEGPDGAFATEKLGAPGEAAAFEAFKVEWEKKNGGKWGGPE